MRDDGASVDVSVVMVTYNSRPFLDACLRSLRARTNGIEYEVIVVDNASPDRTAACVESAYPWVRLIARRQNAGLSRAVNEGVAASRGEHVMVVNPDVRFDMDVVGPLTEYLRAHGDVGVAAPRLLNDDGSLQLSCRAFPGYATALFSRYSLMTRLLPGNPFSRRYLMADFDHASERDVDWVSGAALMFPRAVFDAVGGWDPGFFMYSEDVDFCRRVHDAGYRVVYNPEASLVHHIGGSTRTLPARMVVERHRSMWRYYHKHLRGGALRDAVTGAGIAARCALMLAVTAGERVAGQWRGGAR